MTVNNVKELTDIIVKTPKSYNQVADAIRKIDEIKESGSSTGYTDLISKIVTMEEPVQLYLANAIKSQYNSWVPFSKERETLYNLWTNCVLPTEWRSNYTAKVFKDSYNYIPADNLKDLTTAIDYKRECARRREEKFDADKKQIKPDMFSYEIFKQYLGTLKKGLTGKDAVKYVNDIRVTFNQKDNQKIRGKFQSLIWENSNHTVALAKALESNLHTAEEAAELPFIKLYEWGPLDTPIAKSPHIAICLDGFRRLAYKYNVPASQALTEAAQSQYYTHNTAMVKPTALSQAEIRVIPDYLLILNISIEKTENEILTAYFEQMRDYLIKALSEVNPKVLKPYVEQSQAQLIPFQQLNQNIKDAYEQANANYTED